MRRAAPLLAALCACDGASPELGLDAWMQLTDAQYEPGAPGADGSGPEVEALFASTVVVPGTSNRPIAGALAENATSVTLALEGDLGRWITVAGPPDVATSPDLPSIVATASYAEDLPLGPHVLLAQAFDRKGNPGPTTRFEITALPPPAAEGVLIVSLSWDTNADLDLHVVDPLGEEIHKGDINSWDPPPPGEPVDPMAFKSGAILDIDSNAQCVIDGRCQENAVWAADPPPGRYTVRVDTFSMCEQVVAHWTVQVIYQGELIESASGVSNPIDATTYHSVGAGLLALEIDLP